ncbi:PA2778 family cysteine peptidase [Ideonella margarita]|uniref:PA2778 family cysteine peptidase n=1 Tax=Ideonella margarita TaxID=2984191 RepID=A0ABU9C3I0_9BURK
MQPASRRRWLTHAAAWATTGVGGCATALDAPMTARWLREAPAPGQADRVDLRAATPLVPQDDELCGPATLAMLLAASGIKVPLAQLVREVYLPGRNGSLQIEMLAATRRHGRVPHVLKPTLNAVWQELQKGRPAGLLLNLSLPIWPRWHYAVLVGLDRPAHQALLHTGTQAAAAWPLHTLEHTWARSQHWAMVALPPGELPVETDPTALGATLLAFERSQGPAATLPAWRAGSMRHAASELLAMGWGNALLATQQPAEAATVFERLAKSTDSTAAWNNLAVVRQQLGQRAAAAAAWQQASRRVQAGDRAWSDAVEATRQELGLPPP